jgi:hypothetical protein
MKQHVLAAALLLAPTAVMAGTYVPVAPVRVAPIVRVAPVHVAPVRVAPVVRVNPAVKPVVVGHPTHVHHHRPAVQPIIVTTATQKPKCADPKTGAKECKR